MASSSPLRPLLKHTRETLDGCLPEDQPTCQMNSDGLDSKLKEVLYAVSTACAAKSSIELSCEEKGDVWHIVVKLWVRQNTEPWMARP